MEIRINVGPINVNETIVPLGEMADLLSPSLNVAEEVNDFNELSFYKQAAQLRNLSLPQQKPLNGGLEKLTEANTWLRENPERPISIDFYGELGLFSNIYLITPKAERDTIRLRAKYNDGNFAISPTIFPQRGYVFDSHDNELEYHEAERIGLLSQYNSRKDKGGNPVKLIGLRDLSIQAEKSDREALSFLKNFQINLPA